MKNKATTLIYGASLLGGLTMAACVWRTEHKIETVSTINAHIVLDIRQEAAQVEDFVREPAPADGAAGAAPKKESMLGRDSGIEFALAPPRAWYSLTSVAYADEAPSAMQAGGMDAAKQARKDRFPAVNAALTGGRLGEDDHGYVAVLKSGDEGAAGTTDALAKAENADRRTIYVAIAKTKDLDESQVGLIEVLFAEETRNQLAGGQQFQAPKEDEQFKKFQGTPLGQRFPDAKPGQWLTK